MWMAFGYGILVWGFVGTFQVIRYILRKHPLSLLGASMPAGLIILNLIFLKVFPRWMYAPMVWVLDIIATLMVLFIIDDVRRNMVIKKSDPNAPQPTFRRHKKKPPEDPPEPTEPEP